MSSILLCYKLFYIHIYLVACLVFSIIIFASFYTMNQNTHKKHFTQVAQLHHLAEYSVKSSEA